MHRPVTGRNHAAGPRQIEPAWCATGLVKIAQKREGRSGSARRASTLGASAAATITASGRHHAPGQSSPQQPGVVSRIDETAAPVRRDIRFVPDLDRKVAGRRNAVQLRRRNCRNRRRRAVAPADWLHLWAAHSGGAPSSTATTSNRCSRAIHDCVPGLPVAVTRLRLDRAPVEPLAIHPNRRAMASALPPVAGTESPQELR